VKRFSLNDKGWDEEEEFDEDEDSDQEIGERKPLYQPRQQVEEET
jgi:hypothetical protein